MNILFGDVVSVNPNDRGSVYDERAIADRVTHLMSDALTSGWEKMPSGSPNWVRRVGNPSEVRNLYQETIDWLSKEPVVPKVEVVYANPDGSRDRFLLTTDEMTETAKTGILPATANVTSRFQDATAWTVEAAPKSNTKSMVGVLALAAAAYLYFK